jgi:rubredoxin
MFERLFEKKADGVLKGMTLEWTCPACAGINFRILSAAERETGEYHSHCRYCKAKYRVAFPPPAQGIPGEAEFYERLDDEHFTEEEQRELIRDYAEIEYMRADNANPREVTGKGRMLEEKIVFFKHRRRL